MNEYLLKQQQARRTGWIYVLMAGLAVYGGMFVPSYTSVRGDWDATIRRILEHELLYRSGIAANVISMLLLLYVSLRLHPLLKHVDGLQANLMVGLLLMGLAIAFTGCILKLAALKIFHGEILTSFDIRESRDMAKFYLRYHSYGNKVVLLFWGLWLIPLGDLIRRSDHMPRLLGFLLWINGAAYVLDALTFILFPEYGATVGRVTFPAYFAGELPLMIWLIIKGVKAPGQL